MDFPRRCIFVATTERDDWNHDDLLTARRFMPIRCLGEIERGFIEVEREQWLAEARDRLMGGESAWDIPEKQAVEEQMARAACDAIDESVANYLARRQETTIAEIIEYALFMEDRSKWAPGLQHRVVRALRKAGWIDVRKGQNRIWRNRSQAILPETPAF